LVNEIQEARFITCGGGWRRKGPVAVQEYDDPAQGGSDPRGESSPPEKVTDLTQAAREPDPRR